MYIYSLSTNKNLTLAFIYLDTSCQHSIISVLLGQFGELMLKVPTVWYGLENAVQSTSSLMMLRKHLVILILLDKLYFVEFELVTLK